ncbi:MAG: C1 family peptidase [Elusimicrobia bacterium]|nr:C1 family peptidase [Elusimicrobiota bacterium]
MRNEKPLWTLAFAALFAGLAAAASSAQEKSMHIASLNSKIKAAHGKWTAGETAMSKLSDEEFKARLLSPEDIAAGAKTAKQLRFMPLGDSTAGTSFDWRTKGIETPVRDQGRCGSCWAFSMSGAEELQLLIKKPDVYQHGGEVQRSPQALVSCDTRMKGCQGGRLDASYLVDTGLPAESVYPYKSGTTQQTGTCGDGADPAWMSKTEKIGDWGQIEDSVDNLKKAVSQYGPIPTAMMVFEDFKHYQSGVYTQTPGSKFLGGHAILIVGYDDASQSFIVKNSWTTQWGENGYFRIAYSEAACDLMDMLLYHQKVNFGCMTIAYNMKGGGSARNGASLVSDEASKKVLNVLSSPLQ